VGVTIEWVVLVPLNIGGIVCIYNICSPNEIDNAILVISFARLLGKVTDTFWQ